MSVLVSNSLSLRQYYHDYRSLVVQKNRSDVSTGTLSFADSQALRNAIRRLGDYDFEESSDDDLYSKLKAFTDTCNYTITSGTKYAKNDDSVKRAISSMKSLNREYEDELKKYGVTMDDQGNMQMSDSAPKNISHEKFKKMFGSESEYMNKLYNYAKRINKKVDIRL